jgi:O-antigen/teichoic acid export membrane protein
MDRPVIFALTTKVWNLLAGPITILLIARHFRPDLQGLYYTFGSLLLLQSFVELGLFQIVINVTSHEWAHLSLGSDGRIIGAPAAISRLVSLGRAVFKWYGVVSTIFVVVLSTIGWIFFSRTYHSGVRWQAPWLLLVLLTGLLLWVLPFNSLLEGCNQVAVINRFRLVQAVLGTLSLWVVITLGGGLWALVVSTGVSLLRDLYLVLVQYRRFFKPFFRPASAERINWRSDVWPMQWRIGSTGLVSYFAYSLFNPVLFKYHGAELAGRMGMTWSLIGALQASAFAWVQPKVPRFGILIARKQYTELDRLFRRTATVALIVAVTGAAILWFLIYALNVFGYSLAGRLLPPLPTALFLMAAILMQFSWAQAAYLRAHRKDPLAPLSIISSIAIGLLVWQLGKRYGALGAGIGYLAVVSLVITPFQTALWLRCRAAWHKS